MGWVAKLKGGVGELGRIRALVNEGMGEAIVGNKEGLGWERARVERRIMRAIVGWNKGKCGKGGAARERGR